MEYQSIKRKLGVHSLIFFLYSWPIVFSVVDQKFVVVCFSEGSYTLDNIEESIVASDDLIEMEGVVTEVYQGGNFEVETNEGLKVKAHLAGKLRRYRIRVVLGDKVTVAVSPYDRSKGRITFRHK